MDPLRGKEREEGKLDLPYCHSPSSPCASCQEHTAQEHARQGEEKGLGLCAGRLTGPQGDGFRGVCPGEGDWWEGGGAALSECFSSLGAQSDSA